MGEQGGLGEGGAAATATASTATPESARNAMSGSPSVSGTSAGRGSITFRPKRRATS